MIAQSAHNATQRGRIRQGQRQPAVILPFAPPDTRPRCAWCDLPFTPTKVNQRHCKPSHSRAACARRKEALVWAVCQLLERYGASPETALAKAADVAEAFYAERVGGRWVAGRAQRAMQALGWRYSEAERMWVQA